MRETIYKRGGKREFSESESKFPVADSIRVLSSRNRDSLSW